MAESKSLMRPEDRSMEVINRSAELPDIPLRALRGEGVDQHEHDSAWREVWDHYDRKLRAVLASRIRNPDDLADVVSLTWQRARSRIASYEPTGPFGGWLFRIGERIITNAARAAQRRAKHESAAAERLELERAARDVLTEIEMRVTLEKVLVRLTPGEREYVALLLRGLSHSVIAKQMGYKSADVSRKKRESIVKKARLILNSTQDETEEKTDDA
jgi:RNA polymerase sigma factor (sigma-70 family)